MPAQKPIWTQTLNNLLGEPMKKICFLFLALPLFANDAQEVDAPSTPLDGEWFQFVSLTPTNVVFKCPSYGRLCWIFGGGVVQRIFEYDEEFAIPLDQEISFSDGWHVEMIYTPILLANQQKGFRVAFLGDNMSGGYNANVWHAALSDPPMQVDESEVLMILENGKWMNIEDVESLEDKKLRWKAGTNIGEFPSDIQDPETIARLSTNSYFGPLWAEMITHGLVTPNAEVIVALVQAGYLPSNENASFVVSEKLMQEAKAVFPPRRFANRAWLWLLALPAAAGGVWLVVRLVRRKP